MKIWIVESNNSSRLGSNNDNIINNDSGNMNCTNGRTRDIIMQHVKGVELLEIWNNHKWRNIGLIN